VNSAIIVAAGSSRRMGVDKLTSLLQGKPVIAHSLDRFEECDLIEEVMLVIRPDRRLEFEQIVRTFGFKKIKKIIEGGKERHFSVWNGLNQLSKTCEIVAVHDAARPMISSTMIKQAIVLAREVGATSLAAPIVETLKRVDPAGNVTDNVDRAGLWGMQTPQVFRADWLTHAYKRIIDSGRSVTDEVSAVQEAGYPVRLLQNPDWNIKITFPRDLEFAEKLINSGITNF
jgi:2-C-methyl-D-erythritol 4-phosphate cytidylyltransferase